MTFHFSPDAPWILHAFAATLLFAHIAGGLVGIASGFVAILARRGGRTHRAAGNVFFVAMLCMTGVGATVSPLLPDDQWTNTTAGTFSLYLVITGWAAVRRRAGESGLTERGGFVLALGLALMGLVLALRGGVGGEDITTVYIFCTLAAVAAFGDYLLLRQGGLRGPARIARHLWRMGLALTIATGSLFVGQQDELPKVVQGTFLIAIPPLAALGLMLFWLVRTRLPRRLRPAAA